VEGELDKNANDTNNSPGSNGIKNNFLDKPEEIRIAGKGVIKIVYSADGEKLQRKFISETEDKIKITTYINQFQYEETTTLAGAVLSPFGVGGINFEEGRIRIITPTAQGNGLDALTVDGNMDLPGGKRGAYDYFVMDYQQNVRMILTEEIHSASNTATMESSRSVLEESIFGQVGGANEVATTRYPASSTSWTNSGIGSSVSRLGTNSGHNIGPNTLQKVMAGDMVSATVQYYHGGAAGGNSGTMVSTMLSSLVQAITGGSASGSLVKNNAGNISTQLSGTGGFINAVQPNGSNPAGNTPQAFLTVIFFDERFNMVPAADGGVAQQQVAASVGSNGLSLTLPNVKAPKNGYAYIYLSNQSTNDVYFDNFQAGIVQGNIAEENHYYSYGLRISTLSSKKLSDGYEGNLKNNYLYNGKVLFDDADLNWYDYGFRNYDPQIGRFTQLDPLTDSYPFLTPYQYASCDPITNIDVDGLEGCPSVGGMTGYVGNAGRAAVGGAGAIFNGISAVGKAIGPILALTNLAVNVVNTSSQQSLVKQQLAGKSVNGDFTTGEVGTNGNIHGPNTGGASNISGVELDENEPTYWPVYNSPDAAAYGFAKYVNDNLDINNTEYSSVIYQIKKKGGKSYFSFTIPSKFPDKDLDRNGDRLNQHYSPDADDIIKVRKLLPKGNFEIFEQGHIHNHPFNDEGRNGNNPSNWDANIKGAQMLALYYLNSYGTLFRYKKQATHHVPIAKGFKYHKNSIELTPEFNYGEDTDVSEKNFHLIFK